MLAATLVIIVMIQFVRPTQNKDKRISDADITRLYAVPDELGAILRNSCFDCHSSNTNYPWYANIQPMGWWLASHIREGKNELNFSDFGSYSQRKQSSKLEAIKNSITDETMPLPSYVFIHRKTKLSAEEKEKIKIWINDIQDSLSRR